MQARLATEPEIERRRREGKTVFGIPTHHTIGPACYRMPGS
jgi:hypothetical protein